jgi:prephenate dehydratase
MVSTNLDQDISETQTKTKVAIQGYAGAFHEIAARLHFGEKNMEITACNTFEKLIKSVEKGEESTAGLMAIENSLAGSIMFNYQLLHASDLQVTGEVYLRIKQNLMTLPGTKIEDLEEVHSHYMAIAQCRPFFRDYPHIRLVESADTALSAKHIRDNNLTKTGAIASTLAAELYDLDMIAPSIETNKKNYTRFLVLHPKETAVELPEANKVSLCFSTAHEVGGLHKILGVLAAYGVNLTKIQSSPIVGKEWEYLFFVDFIANQNLGWQQALDAIRPLTTSLRILGVYPKGQHFEY